MNEDRKDSNNYSWLLIPVYALEPCTLFTTHNQIYDNFFFRAHTNTAIICRKFVCDIHFFSIHDKGPGVYWDKSGMIVDCECMRTRFSRCIGIGYYSIEETIPCSKLRNMNVNWYGEGYNS